MSLGRLFARFLHKMQHKSPFILLLAGTLFLAPGHAQSPALPYNGLRIALFDFKILNTRGKTVSLKCRIANTGRETVGGKKTAAETFVELDTANLPAVLWGHEAALAETARSNLPKINPGEISAPVWLKFALRTPGMPTTGGCADLVLDTAYIYRYNGAEITMRYILQNIGNAAFAVTGDGIALGVNFYFISGNKLTRGAIPAGSSGILLGRETLTGWLNPKQRLLGEMVIDLKNRTRFAPNILIELAVPANLRECDRTNNTRAVTVKY
jgi:hypothetical protein